MGYFGQEVSGENDGFNFDSLQGMILNEEIAKGEIKINSNNEL